MGKEKRDNRKELNVTEHLCSAADCFKVHGTDPTKGLSSTQVGEQRTKYGSNCLTPPVTKSLLRLYIDQAGGSRGCEVGVSWCP